MRNSTQSSKWALGIAACLVASYAGYAPGLARGDDKSDVSMDKAASAGLTHDQIMDAQKKLEVQGYDAGRADGVMGHKTTEAVRKFQKDHHQQVTGNLDSATMSALGVQAAGQAADQPADPAAGQSKDMDSSDQPESQGNPRNNAMPGDSNS